MKSPSTLTAYHEKAILTLEFLQKSKDRVSFYRMHLKLWRDRHNMHFVHGTYKRESEIIEKIITSHRAYQRIKKYYFNLLNKMK